MKTPTHACTPSIQEEAGRAGVGGLGHSMRPCLSKRRKDRVRVRRPESEKARERERERQEYRCLGFSRRPVYLL